MTTIAYKNGVLAADSHVSYDGTRVGECNKIHKINEGVVTGAGAFGEILRVRDWIKAGSPPGAAVEIKESTVVWVRPDGSVVEYDPSGRIEYDAPFYAYGTGRLIAIGAMAAGASALDAVRIACEWDQGSGGAVKSVRVATERGDE